MAQFKSQSICLPDPSEPGSLAAVQRAADNLANVGKIVVGDSKAKAQATMIYWNVTISDRHCDEAAARLVSIAAQRIGPVTICICPLAKLPLIL